MIRGSERDRGARFREALLRAGREERASSSARKRVLVAVLAEAALLASSSSAAAAKSSVTATSGDLVPTLGGAGAATTRGIAAWKLIAVLVAASAGGAITITYGTRARPPVVSSSVIVPVAPEATVVVAPGVPSAVITPPEVASMSVEDLPSVKAVPARSSMLTASAVIESGRANDAVARASSPAVADAGAPSRTRTRAVRLDEETAAVAAIRAALRSGDARRAIQLVDAYEAEFASGVLAEEAMVLRIESLVRAGDRAEAARRARAFLAERPGSPYAPRLQSMNVGASEPE